MKKYINYAAVFMMGAALCAGAFTYVYQLRTVGIVNGIRIRKCDIAQRMEGFRGNAVKNAAKDLVFFAEMEKIGVKASDDEIEAMLNAEAEKYGGIAEIEKILLDTNGNIDTYRLSIKKSILRQKAIDLFASEVKGSEEEKQEKGREKYQSVIDKLEETTEIVVF